jgi:DNA-binding transcriptional MerR regulator
MSSQEASRRALTISEFGRRSGLSHKALRLYDLSGLLAPARVDPVTGYRLYEPDQLERARRIGLLRQLDMPLTTVAEVLAQPDGTAAYYVDRWWADQEASIRAKRRTREFLHAELTHPGTERERRQDYPVELRRVAEAKVASVRREVDQQGLAETISCLDERLHQHLREQGAEPAGAAWVVYHGLVTPDCEGTIEVYRPFTGPADPAGPIVIRIEPARTEAFCTIPRDDCWFPRIVLAHQTVRSWVDRSGLTIAGAPREEYLGDWDELSPADPCARITLPVNEAGDQKQRNQRGERR